MMRISQLSNSEIKTKMSKIKVANEVGLLFFK